ncbi:hypothetical protein [Terriglobus tenax]|uniref:hypothetical protein n=1 Tax=Terriglobus tenax TaxID=1111115 RepID=UPI0021DFF2DB|nr:hypothetical protein [Terriglobus tenax]
MQMSTEFAGRRIVKILGVFALAAGSLVAKAQTAQEPKLDLTPSLPSLNQYLHDTTPEASYSSSQVAMVEPAMNFSSSEMQPPPRRQYGRPRYNDRNHNPDGSNRYTFAVGGGFAVPAGHSGQIFKPSWKFMVGGGVNFNKTVALLLEYNYDHFGMTQGYLQAVADANDMTQLGGNGHLWSVTLNPMITYYHGESLGAYIIGGGGFYRKLFNFTQATTQLCYSPYYGYYYCTGNQTIAHWSNNAGGANLGAGFTWKVSKWSNQKFFAEARYVWVNNQKNLNNGWIEANDRTGYFPVTFGLRW